MSIIFPTAAITGDTVTSSGFTWIRETTGEWTRIINSTAFAQAVITTIMLQAIPLPQSGEDLYHAALIKQGVIVLPIISNAIYSLTHI
jgi:hypothetical protein